MMKEIKRVTVIDRAFLRLPEDFRDWATIRFAEYFLQFGPGHGFATNRGRWWGRRIMDFWLAGKPTPFSEFAEGVFDGFRFNLYNLQDLPETGGQILVVNEPATGPERGNWVRFLVNLAVAKKRQRKGNYEARWVHKENSDLTAIQNTPLSIQKNRLSQMISRSCGTILVDANGDKKSNIKALLEMTSHLKDGGVLVICPEAKHNKVLGKGRREAAELVSVLCKKTGVALQPVAAWDEGSYLNLRFGEITDINSFACNEQKMADLIMLEIAKLLPTERRGVYQKYV